MFKVSIIAFGLLIQIANTIIIVARPQPRVTQWRGILSIIISANISTNITMEDILEEIVGEIWDERDEEIDEFKKIGETPIRFFALLRLRTSENILNWKMRKNLTYEMLITDFLDHDEDRKSVV